MDSSNELSQAINNISLEEEEEGGLDLVDEEPTNKDQSVFEFDAKLCVVARFLSEGNADFLAMQQTLAALWRPAEAEIVRPYGSWMRAPFRRSVRPIGAKWLQNGVDITGRNMDIAGRNMDVQTQNTAVLTCRMARLLQNRAFEQGLTLDNDLFSVENDPSSASDHGEGSDHNEIPKL
ncbi:hypothetical protein POM88_020807 [Heracleum sosnowskyi]|uniref:Uncharacterized protein n=1 Tax=Heracleum sosnowskyi TaxID=360622 RepID=A0AAD8MS78_9APIA|nr:hypothetical protein POM88_020807 [Heracleum sosnowskyi]